ncbi:MAG: response regulator [Candidatus Saccharibacteria bacterium]|nr:response regulator [Candidatus Saccharibacteria bacterium]
MTKILLVEDDKSLREIYGVRLLAEGYDIVSAGDGEEALAMAIKEKPQLIISDVMMPKISGFDMLDILRSTTETRDIKVIMMTALSSEDQRSRGEQLGADKYLVKSQVGIEDVVHTVHEVMGDSGKGEAPASSTDNKEETTTPAPAATDTEKPAETVPPTSASDASSADDTQPPTNENTENDMQPTDNTPQTTPTVEPTNASNAVPVASTPGNEGAGPLPPQPSEVESALPQPTAPFSSPAPHSLGEQITQPEATTTEDQSTNSVLPPVDLVSAVENEPVIADSVQPPVGEALDASAVPSESSEPTPSVSEPSVSAPAVEPASESDQVTPGAAPTPGAPLA